MSAGTLRGAIKTFIPCYPWIREKGGPFAGTNDKEGSENNVLEDGQVSTIFNVWITPSPWRPNDGISLGMLHLGRKLPKVVLFFCQLLIPYAGDEKIERWLVTLAVLS